MRDAKGRFKPKELLLPLPSTTMVLNILILIFILLPWFYEGLKFNIPEKKILYLIHYFLIILDANTIIQMVKINNSKGQKIKPI